mgnify:CR=1 FL=1
MTAPECSIRGCALWRQDPSPYCADHLERFARDPHWIPCYQRDGLTYCALCRAEVIPARRDTNGMIAALERADDGRVQLLDRRQFIVLDADGVSHARHAGIDLYRSHGPTCPNRPVASTP